MIDYYTLAFLIILCIGVLVFVKYNSRFNVFVEIKDCVNNRKIIRTDKGAEKIGPDGIMRLRLRREKVSLNMPPPDAIEIDNKGRKHVTLYKIGDYDYLYVTDKNSFSEEDIKRLAKGNKDNPVSNRHDNSRYLPLTTPQRMAFVNQLEKAHTRRPKKISEMLFQMAPLIAIVIIAISLMVFYPEIAKPIQSSADAVKEVAGKLESMEKERTTQIRILDEISRRLDIIEDQKKEAPE